MVSVGSMRDTSNNGRETDILMIIARSCLLICLLICLLTCLLACLPARSILHLHFYLRPIRGEIPDIFQELYYFNFFICRFRDCLVITAPNRTGCDTVMSFRDESDGHIWAFTFLSGAYGTFLHNDSWNTWHETERNTLLCLTSHLSQRVGIFNS